MLKSSHDSPGVARVKLGQAAEQQSGDGGRAGRDSQHWECWPKAVPGGDPPQAAVGTSHVGGREIPFVSPIPFLVLSRRGPSPAFQGMGY